MRLFISAIIILFFLPQTGTAQTRTDSIAGKYTRHTWDGVGMTNIDYGNGTSAEIAGYTISTTDEILILDKNHCSALTVNTQPGNYGSLFTWNTPIIYYGIWRMSGDTISITYSKSFSEQFYFAISPDGSLLPATITKMDSLMYRKYLFEDGSLSPLVTEISTGTFYKEEKVAL